MSDFSYTEPGYYSLDLSEYDDEQTIEIEVRGGAGEDAEYEHRLSNFGAASDGGGGGVITGTTTIGELPDEIDILVGEEGNNDPQYGDGGAGWEGDVDYHDGTDGYVNSGGGGGASEVFVDDRDEDENRLLVAGGGGGGTCHVEEGSSDALSDGAPGGYPEGENAESREELGEPEGGDQSSGGEVPNTGVSSAEASDGRWQDGGDGDTYRNCGIGAGGGGYYGGAGGYCHQDTRDIDEYDPAGAGGAGGSSHIKEEYFDDFTHSTGANSGDGSVYITIGNPSVSDLEVTFEGYEEVDIAWEDEDVEEIDIERDGSLIATVDGSNNSYTDTGLDGDTEYEYQVFAVQGDVRHESSDTIMATTGYLPDETTIDVTDRQITITSVEPTQDYEELRLYRNGDEIDSVEDASDYEYVDNGLLDGKHYKYDIVAVYRASEDERSEEGLTPLPAVEGVEVVDVDGRVATVEAVDPSNNASGYRLLLREDDDGEYEEDVDRDPVDEGETATFETSELLDGQLYGAVIETYTEDTEVRSDDD
ncbi:glycine-rich protein [Natronobacterium gregoryi]|uniref:receptor protein-tyrosine kinase n=2 Tax=Natronobacterium gregoryi TaxID=44930 RepID=L0AGM2_NATGS|nr:fibronectin type III domain-containing protein [Natronobacterium gregoryi]AFZ73048.1 hypothetical protein Natgr_1863 [Natronobacterium gregoryi SP2]ELY70846.1 fibronectin type III domain-containing protein [Natronobacterium gregoryi SP2]PLK20427.1 fibronectin type III domain-containing protein [Natronobacterium gregoryi SP2]SFI62747.1 Glycine rich protein [Natronobacterium gregoryi]